MKIGLDFDGVVCDCSKLKSEEAKRLYDVEIPPERFKKDLIVDTKILTLEQYLNIRKQVYEDPEIISKMIPVDGFLEFAPKLQEDGHKLLVVTSRGETHSQIPRDWLNMEGVYIKVIGIDIRASKANACRGLDVYIDDDLVKLEDLVGVVQHRFLFSWEYNAHIKVSKNIARRIQSWQHFYQELCILNEK